MFDINLTEKSLAIVLTFTLAFCALYWLTPAHPNVTLAIRECGEACAKSLEPMARWSEHDGCVCSVKAAAPSVAAQDGGVP